MLRNSFNAALLSRIIILTGPAALAACGAGAAADETLGADEQMLASADVSDPSLLACTTSATVDPARSLMVTDQTALNRFPLQDVFNQLISKANVAGPSSIGLYQRWWDSQNTTAGAVFPNAIHCDSYLDANGNPSINGFPIQCPRNEGVLATSDPFSNLPTNGNFMKPVAIVNRFDLTPVDGSNCGEYRLIYAKKSGETNITDRNLIILEAVLPNPNPSCGIAACRPVAEFWANLSTLSDPNARANELARFYFQGLTGFSPVIHPANFGMAGAGGARHGQIRTNQFMSGPNNLIWQLREFQLDRVCNPTCNLAIVPTTVKNNPFGPLFDVNFSDPRTASFQSSFISEISSLSAQDADLVVMNTSDMFNSGESNSTGTDNEYRFHLGTGPNTFTTAIDAELANIGRTDLTATNVADRATTQSCGGCHQLSSGIGLGGLENGQPFVWPAHPSPFTFVHVSETSALSPALTNVFLPHRKQVLESFLSTASCTNCSSLAKPSVASGAAQKSGKRVRSLGGSVTH